RAFCDDRALPSGVFGPVLLPGFWGLIWPLALAVARDRGSRAWYIGWSTFAGTACCSAESLAGYHVHALMGMLPGDGDPDAAGSDRATACASWFLISRPRGGAGRSMGIIGRAGRSVPRK